MGTDIGLGIQLRANAQGLQADFNKASKVVEGWKGQMESILSGGLKIAGVTTALTLFKDLASQFREVKREADSVGASIEQMTGLKLFAKGDADAMVIGLQKIQAELGAAADGSEEMRKKFPNWRELNDADPVAILKSLSEEYKTLGTAAEKANFARQLGGRGQQAAWMTMLEKGPEGIDKGQEQGAKYQAWNEALERHAKVWAEIVAYSKEHLGYVADALSKMIPGFGKTQEMKNGELALSLSPEGRQKAIDAARARYQETPEFKGGGQGPEALAVRDKIIGEELQKVKEEEAAGGRKAAAGLEAMAAATKDWEKFFDHLEKQYFELTLGPKGAAHAAIDRKPWTDDQKEQAHAWQNQIDDLKHINDMMKEVAQITEEAKSPMERLKDGIEQLEYLNAFAGLSEEAMDRAAGGLLDKSGLAKQDQGLAPALQVGSEGAERFLRGLDTDQNPVVDKLEQIRQLLADQPVAHL